MKTILIFSLFMTSTLFAASKEGKVTTQDLKIFSDYVVMEVQDEAAEHLYSFLANKLGSNEDVIVTESISCMKLTSISKGDYSLPIINYNCSMLLDDQGVIINNGGDIIPNPRLGVGN